MLPDQLAELFYATPKDFLGPQNDNWLWVMDREAQAVDLVAGDQRIRLQREGDGPFFSEQCDSAILQRPYQLSRHYKGGEWIQFDPYFFPSMLSDFDVHLFHEGTLEEAHHILGAHIREDQGVWGVHFVLWAPNAVAVSVVGDFCAWDVFRFPMQKLPMGLWELFVPGVQAMDVYKFAVRSIHGHIHLKSDPYAFYAEVRPATASRVYDLRGYQWQDAAWIEDRASQSLQQRPVSIYEMHLGSWMNVPDGDPLTYVELREPLVGYLQEMQYTHVEIIGVCEYPYDLSWGYQVTGYFSVNSRYGTPHDFKSLVDVLHQAGIGVIMDWVPGHFPKDAHGLAQFDGTALYEHLDPRQGEHKDWGTLIFNYGRHEVRNFLISSALFWMEEYHMDGLRVDAVASMLYLDYSRKLGEWIPNRYGGNENLEAIQFLKELNTVTYRRNPGITMIAEESTNFGGVSKPVYAGGLGFEFKWNMGWMHDSLSFFREDPVYRKHQMDLFSFSMVYAYSEHFVLSISHDEVVHGKGSLVAKMPGSQEEAFANLRLYYVYMWMHPGKKLLFQGQDFAQWQEWSCSQPIDWYLCEYASHRGVRNLVRVLNTLYRGHPALSEDHSPHGFYWINLEDREASVVSFVRQDTHGNAILVLLNMTPVSRENYQVGVPRAGTYTLLLQSESIDFGGHTSHLDTHVSTFTQGWQSQPHSLLLNLPPLSALVLQVPS